MISSLVAALMNRCTFLLRRGAVVEPDEVVAVHLLIEHGEVALDLLRVQRVRLFVVQVAQLLRLRDADAEAIILGQRRGMGVCVANVGQLAIAASARQKLVESSFQLSQIEAFIWQYRLPFRLQFFGAVLFSHLSQQREARVLDTVSVNILNIYHYFSTLFLC